MRPIVAVILTSLILIFSIIHLGVGISVDAKFGGYGDVFRRERGLAAFNIVISIYGLIIGGFGLFAALTDRRNLCHATAFGSIALALFTFASLITALSINSEAVHHASSRFLYHMNNYVSSQDSRNIINKFQINYVCCGDNIWLDWALVSLNRTGTTTSTLKTTTSGNGGGVATTNSSEGGGGGTATTGSSEGGGGGTATTGSSEGSGIKTITSTGGNSGEGGGGAATTSSSEGGGGGAATTSSSEGGGGGAATTGSSGGGGGGGSGIKTSTSKGGSSGGKNLGASSRLSNSRLKSAIKRHLSSDKATNNLYHKLKRSFLQQVIRRKRQTPSELGLPSSFSVVMPQSCCTTNAAQINNLNNLYCYSNAVSTSNLNANGCSASLSKLAVGQTLGITVINSFLFLISLAAIPILFDTDPYEVSAQNAYVNQPMSQYPQQDGYGYGGYNPAVYNPQIPYTAYNPGYVVYY